MIYNSQVLLTIQVDLYNHPLDFYQDVRENYNELVFFGGTKHVELYFLWKFLSKELSRMILIIKFINIYIYMVVKRN